CRLLRVGSAPSIRRYPLLLLSLSVLSQGMTKRTSPGPDHGLHPVPPPGQDPQKCDCAYLFLITFDLRNSNLTTPKRRCLSQGKMTYINANLLFWRIL